MISPLAQLLIITGRTNQYPEPAKKTEFEEVATSPYRAYCPDCNDEGRDARLPCEGHN